MCCVLLLSCGQRRVEVTITGQVAADVCAAHAALTALVTSRALEQPYTHFLSIPLTSASAQIAKFCEDLCSEGALDASVCVSPGQAHLTLLMLRCLDEERIFHAAAVLRDLKEQVCWPPSHTAPTPTLFV